MAGQARYLIKADLHNYGQTSNNIDEGFERIVQISHERLGSKGVVGIVDVQEERFSKFKKNTDVSGYEDLGHALYFPEKDILVLRGVRTFTRDDSKSLLVFGMNEGQYLKRGDDVGDMIKEAREVHNGVIIATEGQPLVEYFSLSRNYPALKMIDAVETFNGSYSLMPTLNQYSERFFEKQKNAGLNLGSMVSSGGHSLYEIGLSWMQIPQIDKTNNLTITESLRESLKYQRHPATEKRNGSAFVKAMAVRHGLALKYWWAEKSKERQIINDIAQ